MRLVLSMLILDLLFIYTSLFELQMLQQNSYNGKNKFLLFIKNDFKRHYQTYLFKLLLGVLILYLPLNIFLYILVFMALIVLNYNSYFNYLNHNNKLPLKFTARLKRIMVLDYIFYFLVQLIACKQGINAFIGFSLIYITLNSFVLIGIVYLLMPIEKIVFNHYKKEALIKLNKMNNLKIIGITGSFGKTSTKMILDSILKTKYKGFVTPASFNTPNGILMTINNEDTIFNDYFICEMGARKEGEIKELCDMVKPKYAILTSIGAAHLESFKSLDNICKTKFELVESLPADGVAILNKDDEYQRKYKIQSACHKIWVGIDKQADVMASNIKITNEGTTFDVIFKDSKKKLTVSTILLGDKNIYNILSGIALAKHLGVPDTMIKKGVKNIAPINHRLELKKMRNITLLDDSFNSNPNGAKTAVEVLNLMNGKKIIITPGMVEMGTEQNKLNYEFGKQIAKVCDEVYLIGKKQTEPIYKGLIKEKYLEKNIKVLNNFKDAYNEIIRNAGNEKITILIENDLPDSYTEE